MPKSSGQFTSIGGQALIEGVMMRAPHFIAIAVRKPNHRIIIKYLPYLGWAKKFPILKKPVFRGVAVLIESMIQGMDALTYAATQAALPDEKVEKLSNSAKTKSDPEAQSATNVGGKTSNNEQSEGLSTWALTLSFITAIAFGMGLFVVLPHFLTVVLTSKQISAKSPLFHLLDGGIKMAILLSYVYLIALMKDIKRVFQYHGAEHKSIYAFEAGEELTVENARKHSTLHPRCGTSFLLLLVLISVLVFSILFPLFHLTEFSQNPVLNHGAMILVKMVFMLPVSGLAYEFIKMCACRMGNPLFRALLWPGMILQKLTTREPDDTQLEVALTSLVQVLKLEKEHAQSNLKDPSEIEIAGLLDLTPVRAFVTEFPE